MILATQLGIPLFLSMGVIEKAGRVIEVAESEGVGQEDAMGEGEVVQKHLSKTIWRIRQAAK